MQAEPGRVSSTSSSCRRDPNGTPIRIAVWRLELLHWHLLPVDVAVLAAFHDNLSK